MKKLKEINGYVRLTLDRVLGIRADLVRVYENWQQQTFLQLVDAFKKWSNRNPKISPSPEKDFKHESAYQINDKKV